MEKIILFVDDSYELRVMMKTFLEDHEFKVLTAENGQNVLQLLPSLRGQRMILMTDFSMPVMSGGELILSLEKMDKHPFEVIFLLSGLLDTDPHLLELLGRKFSVPLFYYQKPFRLNEIISKLKSVA